MNIYVGNLSYQATQDEVLQAFQAYGEVSSVSLIMDKMTGQSRGFGFVEMPDATQATAAINALHTAELNGRAMTVNEAKPREPRGFGGGGGGGRGDRGGRRGW
jgi:cold-inducible RNA-binding protein